MKKVPAILLALALAAPPPGAWAGVSVNVSEVSPVPANAGAAGVQAGAAGLSVEFAPAGAQQPFWTPGLADMGSGAVPGGVTSAGLIAADPAAPALPLSAFPVRAPDAQNPAAARVTATQDAATREPAVPAVGPARAVAEDPSGATPSADTAERTADALSRSADSVHGNLTDPFHPAAPAGVRTDAGLQAAESGFTPSPEAWEDQVFYFLMTDRFARGPRAQPEGDPADGRSVHGGDLEGLIGRLDYLQGLGVTTIVVPPVLRNTPKGYHGYHITSLTEMNERQGTLEIYKRLVREAHARGIYVIQDKVLNHMGLVFDYQGSDKWEGRDHMPKPIAGWRFDLSKEGLGPEDFYRGGILWDWNDHDQERFADPFFDLRQLNTANPATQDKLIRSVLRWIEETDVDGIRLDAFKHFDETFRFRLVKAVRERAAELGKRNFFIFGEIMTRDDQDIVPYLGSHGLTSAYNYPAYFRDLLTLYGLAPMRWLEESLRMTRDGFGVLALALVRFLGTHDVPRFLKDKDLPLYSRPLNDIKGWFEDNLRLTKEAFGKAGEAMVRYFDGLNMYERLRGKDLTRTLFAATALMMFLPGIPMFYYGDEQGLRQPAGKPFEPGNREDLFAEGQYKSASSAGDKFDPASEIYRQFRRLADVRKAYAPLRRGETYVRWSDHAGPGVFAFSRIHDGKEILVVVNTSDDARSADMWMDAGLSPPGTELVDALDSASAVQVYGAVERPGIGVRRARPGERAQGSGVSVRVGPHGVRVFVRRQKV